MFTTIRTTYQLWKLAKSGSTPTAADVDDDPNELESIKFGRAYNKGAARQVLETLKKNAKDADKNSAIALYVSIPHQALYMLSQAERYFSDESEKSAVPAILTAEIAIAIAICLVVPFLVDRAILMNIRTLGTLAASTGSKVRAGIILGIALPWSMWVNFAAPSADIVRYGAAGLIALVAIYQVSRLVSPSFKKLGKFELDAKEELAKIQQEADTAGTVTVAAPASRKAQKSNADKARRLATENPNLKAGPLAKLTGVAYSTAKKILDEAKVAAHPVSPGSIPTTELNADMAAEAAA